MCSKVKYRTDIARILIQWSRDFLNKCRASTLGVTELFLCVSFVICISLARLYMYSQVWLSIMYNAVCSRLSLPCVFATRKQVCTSVCTNHAGNLLVQILDNQVYRLPGSRRGIFL